MTSRGKSLFYRTLMSVCVAPIFAASAVQAGTVYVDNASELQNAMKTASAGDEIILRSGDYTGNPSTSGNSRAIFWSNKSGTSSNPITVRSQYASSKQVLKGSSVQDDYLFFLENADHWVVKDLKFTNAQKGIMLEGSSNNVFDNFEVWNVGAEAVHLRVHQTSGDSSSNNIVKNCYIHHTGKRTGQEGFGEGVYVGTHDGHQTNPQDNSNDNRIGGCYFGPYVTAEAFDVKAGTTGTIIENNYMDALGIVGDATEPGGDSFIDIKGDEVVIRDNVMDYNGESFILWAIFAYDQHTTSNVYDNTYTLPTSAPIYKIVDETLHLSNNTRTDSGTAIVEASYQDDHYDYVLDTSLDNNSHAPYACFDELTSCSSPPSGGGSSSGGGYAGSKDLPGKIEAEKYADAPVETTTGNTNTSSITGCTYYGLDVDVEDTSDDGTCNVGWTASGEKLEYQVGSAGASGNYDINLRAAANSTGKDLKVRVNGTLVGTVTVTNDGWSTYNNHTISNVAIPNNATIQVEFVSGGVNLNYLDITNAGSSSGSADCTIMPSNNYAFKNMKSGLLMDLTGMSTANGANIQQYGTYSGGSHKQWTASDGASGYFYLNSVKSGLRLDVAGISTADGANLQQWSTTGSGGNKQFKFTAGSNGGCLMKPKHSDKCIEVVGGSMSNGANVEQNTCNGSAEQEWEVIPK